MPTRVKLPDGSIGEFPDGMSERDIEGVLAKQFPSASADSNVGLPGVPSAPIPSGLQGPPPTPSLFQRAADAVTDTTKGAMKGGLNTLRGIGNLEAKIPGLKSMMPGDVQDLLGPLGEQMTAPHGTAQKIGYGGEQVGEFLLPGGAEEKGAAKLAELAPKLGKFAKPLAKVLTSGVSSGAVNAAQGGSPVTGALMGAGGAAVGQVAKAAAPAITEFAQGITTPGQRTGKAILAETKGILPGSIRESARGVLDTLNPQLDAAAQASTMPVSLLPARQTAQDLTDRAFGQNEPKMYRGVKKMGRMVNQDLAGNPLPAQVPPYQALEIKRGIGKAQPKGSWNPESSNAFKGPRTDLYNSVNQEFLKSVPEAGPLNSRISALIPATEAGRTSFSRYVSPAIGTMMGGYTGSMRGMESGENGPDLGKAVAGGLTGALMGGTVGYAAPTAMNAFARTASSSLMPPVVRALTGSTLQLNRKSAAANPPQR